MQKRHMRPSATTRPVERTVEQIQFVLNMPEARVVGVAGTFNNWEPKRTPLRKEADGNWKTTVALAPGRYEYRFVVDGKWVSDPKARASVENSFGTTNSVLEV